MSGMAFMLVCLIVIGALGCFRNATTDLAVGIIFVISTLCNMITIGPACYPIVAETPSGRLRYKTISIGRVVYNLTEWNWGAKSGLVYAATNLVCLIWCWFRLPENKNRTFGEIDMLFELKVPARKFKTTHVDQFEAHGVSNEKMDGEATVERVP